MKKLFIAVMLVAFVLAMPVSAAPDAPEITMEPQNYQYPEYSVAIYTVKASGTNLRAIWYLEYEGVTYNLSDNQNGIEPWEGYAGETYGPMEEGPNTFSWFFGGIEEGLNGAQIWCVIEDGHYDVTSQRAIITVQGDAMPPEILDMPACVTAQRGEEVGVRCLARSGSDAQLAFQWYETDTGKLQDIRAIDGEESDFLSLSTELPGTRYFVCCVTATDGGRVYSAVLPVTVADMDPEPVQPPEVPDEETTLPTDTTPPVETAPPVTESTAVPTDPTVVPTVAQTQPTEASQPAAPTAGQAPSGGMPVWILIAVCLAALATGACLTLLLVKRKTKDK